LPLALAGVLVVVAVSLGACGSIVPTAGDATDDLARDIFYTGGQTCQPSVWITGVIVKGPLARESKYLRPSDEPVVFGTGIQDDKDGVIYGIIWGLSNTARIEYGKRYKLGGSWFGNPRVTFWACAGAGAVIPQ
jgi:hypothetical protein